MAGYRALVLYLAALACLAGSQARDLQQTSSTCSVSTSAKSFSMNQLVCKSAYQQSINSIVVHYCTNPHDPVPPEVKASISASVTTIVNTMAQGTTRISYSATISPSCEVGSYSYFDARARAKAMARAVAQSYVNAWIQILGQQAFAGIDAEVYAASNAIAATCETKFVEIQQYHMCSKGSCTSTCPVTCYYQNEQFVEAATEAVANAFVEAEAIVETYVNNEDCADCGITLCDYVCQDGC